MRILANYARSTFWTIGMIQILLGGYAAITTAIRPDRSSGLIHALAILLLLLIAGLGVLSCLAASAWRRQKTHATPLVAIASIFSLIFFPFGTVAGITGLYWCCSPKMREAEPLPGAYDHEPKPDDATHAWVQKLFPIASVAIWIASLMIIRLWGRSLGLPNDTVLNGLVLILLCQFVTAFLHESGHAIAGWASEMSLVNFSVGALALTKQRGKWRVSLSPAALLGAGGGVTSYPLHLKNLRSRMAFSIAAGPVASLTTALVAAVVTLAIPGSGWERWWNVPAVISAMAAGDAILNLIPFGFAAGYSDGAALVQLWRGGRFADLRMAMMMSGSTMVSPLRPRDLDPAVPSRAMLAASGKSQEWFLYMLQVIWAVDRGDLALARTSLESSLQRVPNAEAAPSPACAAEIALYIAYLDGNAARAAAWLRDAENSAAKKRKSLADESDYWRAVTAVRRAEGREPEAEQAYRRAVELLDQKPRSGQYQAERELLELIRLSAWLHRAEAVTV